MHGTGWRHSNCNNAMKSGGFWGYDVNLKQMLVCYSECSCTCSVMHLLVLLTVLVHSALWICLSTSDIANIVTFRMCASKWVHKFCKYLTWRCKKTFLQCVFVNTFVISSFLTIFVLVNENHIVVVLCGSGKTRRLLSWSTPSWSVYLSYHHLTVSQHLSSRWRIPPFLCFFRKVDDLLHSHGQQRSFGQV